MRPDREMEEVSSVVSTEPVPTRVSVSSEKGLGRRTKKGYPCRGRVAREPLKRRGVGMRVWVYVPPL